MLGILLSRVGGIGGFDEEAETLAGSAMQHLGKVIASGAIPIVPDQYDPGHSYRTSRYGVTAMTRRGLPEPPTIFNGAAMTTAPVAGS